MYKKKFQVQVYQNNTQSLHAKEDFDVKLNEKTVKLEIKGISKLMKGKNILGNCSLYDFNDVEKYVVLY